MEYQEVLREQMKMKKAKDDEERRLRLEQEFRDEQRFKEEFERERLANIEEQKMKNVKEEMNKVQHTPVA